MHLIFSLLPEEYRSVLLSFGTLPGADLHLLVVAPLLQWPVAVIERHWLTSFVVSDFPAMFYHALRVILQVPAS